MKGGLAVMLELARRVVDPAVDVTYVFYACEEIEQRFSGLFEIDRFDAPGLLVADAAVLGEPTVRGSSRPGCQGVLRVACAVSAATRAHAARSWTGVNAIHRLRPAARTSGGVRERRPVVERL